MKINICTSNEASHFADTKLFQYSVRKRSSIPVDFRYVPAHEKFMRTRREQMQTTSFAFTRFLTPLLWKNTEFSVFMDPDMFCLCDIKDLVDCFDSNYAVQVVKHNYVPKFEKKKVGTELHNQTNYHRKNWSSLIVFNNELALKYYTEDTIKNSTGLDLNTFSNIPDYLIGELPKEFNHLVLEDNQSSDVKIAHFTNGNPYQFPYTDNIYAKIWEKEYDECINQSDSM